MKKVHNIIAKGLIGLVGLGLILLTACTKNENPGPSNTNTYGFELTFDSMPYSWYGLPQPSGINGCSQISKSGLYTLILRTETDADTGLIDMEINCSLPSIELGDYVCQSDHQGGAVFSLTQRDLTGNRTFRAIDGNTVTVKVQKTSNVKGGTVSGIFSGQVVYINGNPNTVIAKTVTGSFIAVNTMGF